jgi:hypothetical protein
MALGMRNPESINLSRTDELHLRALSAEQRENMMHLEQVIRERDRIGIEMNDFRQELEERYGGMVRIDPIAGMVHRVEHPPTPPGIRGDQKIGPGVFEAAQKARQQVAAPEMPSDEDIGEALAEQIKVREAAAENEEGAG